VSSIWQLAVHYHQLGNDPKGFLKSLLWKAVLLSLVSYLGARQEQFETVIRHKSYPELVKFLDSMDYKKAKSILSRMLLKMMRLPVKKLADADGLEYKVYDNIMEYFESKSTNDAVQILASSIRRVKERLLLLYIMGKVDVFLDKIKNEPRTPELEKNLEDLWKAINKYYKPFVERKDVMLKAESLLKKIVSMVDRAMKNNRGGIDLTASKMNVEIQTGSPVETLGGNRGIQFHLDPAMLQQLQNAPGFVPVIISIRPMLNLRKFLGIVV
jgi:hypothetical protein